MHLDGFTMIAAGSFAAGVCSLLLLGAWTQIRNPALLWWAAASATNSLGIGLLALGNGTGIGLMIGVGVGINTLSPALVWGGVRRFNHRRQILPLLVASTVVWIIAGALPLPGGPQILATAVEFAGWVIFLMAAVAELWRGRGEKLAARWPLAGFLSLHAFVFVGGIIDAVSGVPMSDAMSPLSNWFSMIHFEGLIYMIGTSVFMALMCKERSERRHIIAARIDSLTGISNRGAFLDSAERVLNRCQAEGRSFSLIMFDLDRFKHINDTFGHDVGDEVLRAFSETTQGVLRPNDLFGRYGGEEFCVVLPGATIEAAFVIAERIRHKFAEAGAFVAGRQSNATVSGGVSSASAETTLQELLRTADQNMYRAKDLGRNRVERNSRQQIDREASVIRVA